MIKQAFILGAGIGARMRPLTNVVPKPMVEIHGKPIIGYALDALATYGIDKCVVNTHYKAEILHDYLHRRTDLPFEIIISYEEDLLDTGGGIQNGLQYLDKSEPVFIVAGDSIWQDPVIGPSTLHQMEHAWDPAHMDLLLLLQPLETMQLTHGVGDYNMTDGKPTLAKDKDGAYMWTSVRILKPALFEPAKPTPFSFYDTMVETERAEKLAGIVHHGDWHHLSTPDDVETLNTLWTP